jgi:hypothetical protein
VVGAPRCGSTWYAEDGIDEQGHAVQHTAECQERLGKILPRCFQVWRMREGCKCAGGGREQGNAGAPTPTLCSRLTIGVVRQDVNADPGIDFSTWDFPAY